MNGLTHLSTALRALLRAYQDVLSAAESATRLTLAPDDAAALDLGRRNRRSRWNWRSWRGRPILRYLLHRHIEQHVSSLRRAYARHAVLAAEPTTFDPDRAVLAAMAECLPSRVSPRRLWILGTVLSLATVRLWIHPQALSEQDWEAFELLRRAIQTIGAGSYEDVVEVIRNASVDVWLVLGYVVAAFYLFPVLLILKRPFEATRVLLSVDPHIAQEGQSVANSVRTVYALERRVFSLLGERPPRVLQIDLCLALAGAAAWVLFWASGLLVFARQSTGPDARGTGEDLFVFVLILPFILAPAGHLVERVLQRWLARARGETACIGPFWYEFRRARVPRLCIGLGLAALFTNWVVRAIAARDWGLTGFFTAVASALLVKRVTRSRRARSREDGPPSGG